MILKNSSLISEGQILLHKEINSLPKVKAFLSSVQRNSMKTRITYATGLAHFHSFLTQNYNHSIDSIIEPLVRNQSNVYTLLEDFLTFMISKTPSMSPLSLRAYMTGIRSYLAYHDVDVIPSKFKRKVKMPRIQVEDKEALDSKDIRHLLLHCTNRRLKTFLLILASGGMRAGEAIGIRLRDIDFSTNPTKIRIRKEFSKTRVARDIFVSDEASQYLKDLISWKNRKDEILQPNPDSLVFQVFSGSRKPLSIYVRILKEFENLLSIAKLDARQEGMKRRKITLHSFRRFVKTVISNQVNQDYSEWFLGHNKSPYYTIKEAEKREIYKSKCMKYLTFLDYSTLEATGKNIEVKLEEKDREIQMLKEQERRKDQDMTAIKEQVQTIMKSLGIVDTNSKTKLAKHLIQKGMYKKEESQQY